MGMAHYFAIGFEAFCVGHVFSNFACFRGCRCEPSKCMVLSSCCGQLAIFPKNVDLLKELTGV